MTVRELLSKGSKVWFQWASFKLGFFCGAVVMALYMGVLIAVPQIGQAILGAVQ